MTDVQSRLCMVNTGERQQPALPGHCAGGGVRQTRDSIARTRMRPGGSEKRKSNTLTKRSTQVTTLSTVYDSVELILDANGIKLDPATRPSDNDIESYQEIAKPVWEPILEGVPAYRGALADTSTIPGLREDSAPTSLLFKPASQLSLIDAL